MVEETQTPDRQVDENPLTSVPVEIMVSVGRAQPLLRDLLSLDVGSVLELDKSLEDPVELFVGDRLIGFGALEIVEDEEGDRLSVRITRMADLATAASGQ